MSRDARLRIASPGNVAGYHVKFEAEKLTKAQERVPQGMHTSSQPLTEPC